MLYLEPNQDVSTYYALREKLRRFTLEYYLIYFNYLRPKTLLISLEFRTSQALGNKFNVFIDGKPIQVCSTY